MVGTPTPLSLNGKVHNRIRYELIGRRRLNSGDVRELVFESIGLIDDAQMKLQLPICENLAATRSILKRGNFQAAPLRKEREGKYHTLYGDFSPPATIILDDELPFCDSPLDIPEVPRTMTYYTSVHEVIHADDYAGGDRVVNGTRQHILEDHKDKLDVSMEIIRQRSDDDCIRTEEELAGLWAIQYADLLTHYRSYVVIRQHKFPRLDFIWDLMQSDLFPPSLLTKIEREKGTRYIFETIIDRVGEYCLIDALRENIHIGERNADAYTV